MLSPRFWCQKDGFTWCSMIPQALCLQHTETHWPHGNIMLPVCIMMMTVWVKCSVLLKQHYAIPVWAAAVLIRINYMFIRICSKLVSDNPIFLLKIFVFTSRKSKWLKIALNIVIKTCPRKCVVPLTGQMSSLMLKITLFGIPSWDM